MFTQIEAQGEIQSAAKNMFTQTQVWPPTFPPPLAARCCVRFDELNGGLSSHEARKNWHQSNYLISQSPSILRLLNGNLNSTAYASVLDSCGSPNFGRQLHAHLLKNGFHGQEFVQTKLLQMYGKWGCFSDAALVFDRMPERNLYTFTSVLTVLLDNGLFREAYVNLERLLKEDVDLDFFVFPVAFKICSGFGGVELGRQLHGIVVKIGVLSHIYLGNSLIDMYGKCGCLNDAEMAFDNMLDKDCVSWNCMVTACAANGRAFEALNLIEEMLKDESLKPNSVTWNALISGFAQNGCDEEAIAMLHRMGDAGFQLNARTLACVLPSCARLRKLGQGKEIYGYIIRHGFMSSPYIDNGLIDLYRRCGDTGSALKVFSKLSGRGEVSFNTMITGYCDHGEIQKAKELFDMMDYEGKTKDLITWNSMLSGYAENLMFKEALELLIDIINKEGIEPDSFTLGSALGVCADTQSLRFGAGIHSYCIVKGLQSNAYVGSALVKLYCQSRNLEAARRAFDQVLEKDAALWNAFVSGSASCNHIEDIQCILQRMKDDGFLPNVYTWNGIIAGYVENGHHELALQSFSDMQDSNVRPDIYTVGIVLPACSRLAAIGKGKQLHAHAIRSAFESDEYIAAALIDIYAKCGIMKNAKLVHNLIKRHNLVTQNAILNAYAMHGQGEEGIAFFREMLVDGFKPDNVTFLAVLSSCVHAGSVDAGHDFFNLMEQYGVTPTLKHYTCMVDLLSRSGQLEQAHKIVERLPMDPDSVIWGALLGGCITHGNADLGEMAAHKLIELESHNPGNYVMLANLYASTGKWDELKKVRQQMKDGRLHKTPGCSWIEDSDKTHVFMACDQSHEKAKEIYDALDYLTAEMRFQEYSMKLQDASLLYNK